MKKHALFLAALLLAAPPAQARDATFAAEANALCRTIINERDYPLFSAGKGVSLDFTLARLQGHDSPSDAEREQLAVSLEAMHAEIEATRDRLLALADNHPQQAADLALFVEKAEYYLDTFSVRITALRAAGPLEFPRESEIDAPNPDPALWDEAIVRLGFARRDCEPVFSSNGNPPEIATFIETVAPACAIAFDNLMAKDLEQWRQYNLDAMVAALQDKPQDPQAAPALKAMGSAWKNAAHAFHLVDSRIEEKPPLWEDAIAILYERARIFEDRAAALQYRDAAAIKEAFATRIGVPDFDKLGLRETSCTALARLM